MNIPTESVQNELEDLELGIRIWGQNQADLEQQALKELEIFAKTDKVDLEEGEIEEKSNSSKTVDPVLNIESYIKQQEELKKRQDYQKSLKLEKEESFYLNQKTKSKKRKLTQKDDSQINLKIAKTEQTDQNNPQTVVSGSEYCPSESESDYEVAGTENNNKTELKRKRSSNSIQKVKDDALLANYKSRLNLYYENLEKEPPEAQQDYLLKNGLRVPFKLWESLYSYQQEALKWLWKLHQKPTGGILGDEMGLGKTVEIIAFLHALDHSKVSCLNGRFKGLGPTVIVCPATVIHQWVKHFHEWAPEFRIAVLHQSGTFQGNKGKLIKDINKNNGILLTTYISILKYRGNLVEHNWHYVILDEGHKIRNNTAKISQAIKELRTPHRIMLTGSPMQNNLSELWSLFDFTNPGMLGNLSTFTEHFANPIIQGGFANATAMQEATGLQMATALKDLISPYLLRRQKSEVQEDICLPQKTEQVLFCELSKFQKDLYKDFLMSDHVQMILGKGSKNWYKENAIRANVLNAITTLRKICNHPDIFLQTIESYQKGEDFEEQYGYYKKSGKMIVVSALLKMWKKQNHRVLLFTQSRSMIDIFQSFLELNNYTYLKMDGTTSIASRQGLIDKFNEDQTIDVFLLTTRVGGLGINLTGANKVIIYDPDWNPATDTQARERAWRIGQQKQVTIYRLLSAGTIEEKIYQRQVWKLLLSNKILIDPKSHRFFKSSDLYDLFSLDEPKQGTETANIFRDSRIKIEQKLEKKKKKLEVKFSEDKIKAMKDLAQQLAKSIAPEKKSGYQKELLEERQKRLEEKQELKKLSAQELLNYNREKALKTENNNLNKIDDKEVNLSFNQALDVANKKAELYRGLVEGKIKESDILPKPNPSESKKERNLVDGQIIEGLVRTEKKKKEKKTNTSQDHYVLSKLFSKKGVSDALQHDSIVEGSSRTQSLKVHSEAKSRVDKSLEALRKSRIDRWRW